jgi:hypothetical protein
MAVVMPRRKKVSAHNGGPSTKRSITPANAIRRGEIVEEIVENLRPWRNHKSRDAITAAVNKEIDKIPGRLPDETDFFDPKQGRKIVKSLVKALRQVEMLLLSLPATRGGYKHYFDPRIRRLAKVDDDYVFAGIDATEEEVLARADAFIKELTGVRKVATARFGYHKNFDVAKHESARTAYRLLLWLSDGKRTGTKDQPFRIITSLLYETISGQRDADLKRACDAVLRPWT